MKKRKQEQVFKTVFNIPSDEARNYLQSIIKDVDTILQNEKFIEATKKVNLPENATIKDYENLVKRVAPNKIYNLMSLLFIDCYNELRSVLSAIFVTDYEIYKQKSLKDMCEDISKLSTTEISQIIRFFIH